MSFFHLSQHILKINKNLRLKMIIYVCIELKKYVSEYSPNSDHLVFKQFHFFIVSFKTDNITLDPDSTFMHLDPQHCGKLIEIRITNPKILLRLQL